MRQEEKYPLRCAGRASGLLKPNEAEDEDVNHENAPKEICVSRQADPRVARRARHQQIQYG